MAYAWPESRHSLYNQLNHTQEKNQLNTILSKFPGGKGICDMIYRDIIYHNFIISGLYGPK